MPARKHYTQNKVLYNKARLETPILLIFVPLFLFHFSMTPIDYYQEKCADGTITFDPIQWDALQHVQDCYHRLVKEHQLRSKPLNFLRKPKTVHGLYLWGGVGIGKTFLIDCLIHCIDFKEKKRMHFHQFMRWIHQSLKTYQGEKNPLNAVAEAFCANTLLLCLDELFVTDITDAMLLANLLKALFDRGICITITSNIAPDYLYWKGLQRPLFLPAIALLKQHTQVLHLESTTDYRLRHLREAGVFYTPNNDAAHHQLEKMFDVLAKEEIHSDEMLMICDRPIPVKKSSDTIVWFDFNVICNVPRSPHDYLEIANQFLTVFISDIPVIKAEEKNKITLFIRLIDVLYDAKIRLVCSAATSVDSLYPEGDLSHEFRRTRSRLLEMQSEAYFTLQTT